MEAVSERREATHERDAGDGNGAITGRVGAFASGNDSSTPGSHGTAQLQLQELRMELQRAARLTCHDGRVMRRASTHFDLQEHVASVSFDSDGSDDGVAFLRRRVEHGLHVRTDGIEQEDNNAEEFLGLSIPSGHGMHEPLQHRAASFSGSMRTRMMPCSPPVPIPQKHWKRRNSVSASTSRTASGSMLIPNQEHEYSKTQCEARLWDEYWNYKLSLESRESFEASSSNQIDRGDSHSYRGVRASSINQPHKMKLRADSEASTEDTARDSCDDAGYEGDNAEVVFDMDDL